MMDGAGGEKTRIERMLREGKLSEGEAQRLYGALDAEQAREEAWRRARGKESRSDRRRIWSLLALFAVFWVVGLAGGWLTFESMRAGSRAMVDQHMAYPVSETAAPGRPIDLSSLDGERSKTMNRIGALSVVVILLLIALVLGGGFLLVYNGLVDGRERVNAAWAQVENVYQRRLDLVPVLIDSVKTYMEHERDTLQALTEARARAIEVGGMLGSRPPQTVEQLHAVQASQGAVKSALARLFAVVESYPDLKASRNFLTLQDQIEGTENRIAAERRSYNELVRRYDARIQKFPGNIVAGQLGFTSKPYFEAETTALKGLKDPFGRRDD